MTVRWAHRGTQILVEAYSPIAHGAILQNADVRAMAEKYGVSVPQLCIRYTLQLGRVSLPKTANPEHMRSNAELDFVIADEDMSALGTCVPRTTASTVASPSTAGSDGGVALRHDRMEARDGRRDR